MCIKRHSLQHGDNKIYTVSESVINLTPKKIGQFYVGSHRSWLANYFQYLKLLLDMNLSLAGCGGLGVYHVGVVSCFRTYAPHVLFNKVGE